MNLIKKIHYKIRFYLRKIPKYNKITIFDNKTIYIRKNSTDSAVYNSVINDQYHLPPIKLPSNSVILDLGMNIGLTVLHYNYLYPDSRIIGLEMDKENFFLAKKNCTNIENSILLNMAIWSSTGKVKYSKDNQEDAYAINSSALIDKSCEINSISIDDLIDEFNLTSIEFIKMDIEGAEKEILTHPNTDWLNIVKSINVEIHDKDFLEEGISILKSKNFKAWKDKNHWSAILAVKEI